MRYPVLLIFFVVFGTCMLSPGQSTPEDDLIYVTAAAWSHDGSKIAAVGIQSAGERGYLHIVDANNGQTLYQLDPEPGGFSSVAWSPDDQFIAAGSYDQSVWVINVNQKKQVATLYGHRATVNSVDWNTDGTRLISGGNWDQKVILWDMSHYQKIREVEAGDIWAVEFSPDNQSIAVGSMFGLAVFPSDLDTSRQNPSWLSESYIGGLAWSHDGMKIAFGTQAFSDKAARLNILSASGTLINSLTTNDSVITNVVWSPDDITIVTTSLDGYVRIWDFNSGKEVENFSIMTLYPSHTAFSPYGGRLAYGLTIDPSRQTQGVGPQSNGIAIVVPDPSLNRLNSIATHCIEDASKALPQNSILSAESITRLKTSDLSDFITQVKALPPDTIPPACAADLIAVAEAMIAQE